MRALLVIALVAAVVAAAPSSLTIPASEPDARPVCFERAGQPTLCVPLGEVRQIVDYRRARISLAQQLAAALARAEVAEGRLAPLDLKQNMEASKAEIAELKRLVEAANPGYTFDVSTGQLTPSVQPPGAQR